MFGLIKENILDKLDNLYKNENEIVFKKEFNKYIKTLKENKNIKKFYEIYDSLNTIKLDDKDVAKEFVEEAITTLKSIDRKDLNKLTLSIGNLKNIDKNSIEYKLDQLVFNENISLSNKVKFKSDLINEVLNKNIKTTEKFNIEESKINEVINSLNEDKKIVLELFLEKDDNKITDFYHQLLTDTSTLVENKILESENSEVVKKLIEVKKRLIQLKNQTPNISEIEDVIELKNSLI